MSHIQSVFFLETEETSTFSLLFLINRNMNELHISNSVMGRPKGGHNICEGMEVASNVIKFFGE
jgi:hypothetical protein